MFILSFFFWFDLGIGLVGVLLFYFLTHFLHVVGLLSFFFFIGFFSFVTGGRFDFLNFFVVHGGYFYFIL